MIRQSNFALGMEINRYHSDHFFEQINVAKEKEICKR